MKLLQRDRDGLALAQTRLAAAAGSTASAQLQCSELANRALQAAHAARFERLQAAYQREQAQRRKLHNEIQVARLGDPRELRALPLPAGSLEQTGAQLF